MDFKGKELRFKGASQDAITTFQIGINNNQNRITKVKWNWRKKNILKDKNSKIDN